jgi:predicted nucleotidyltransferase
MQRDAIIETLRTLQPELSAEGVAHVALFGSRARGDYRQDSDIDLLLDVDEGKFSLLDLIGIEHLVADAIGVPANAFMRRSLDDKFRASIQNELIEVF